MVGVLMKFILGQKIGMTRVFDEEGKILAVTIVKAFPTVVTQIKTVEKDGYNALQVKAVSGAKEKTLKTCEFKIEKPEDYKVGDKISLDQFETGEIINVQGTSKGKGFAGTIKRHGFQRGPETHGSNNVREPGSIGGGYPQRVVKGRRMAGHMGAETITIKNLKIADKDKDILLVKGAIPGPCKGVIKVYSK
jgi:large subunit ribosomal protein L3